MLRRWGLRRHLTVLASKFPVYWFTLLIRMAYRILQCMSGQRQTSPSVFFDDQEALMTYIPHTSNNINDEARIRWRDMKLLKYLVIHLFVHALNQKLPTRSVLTIFLLPQLRIRSVCRGCCAQFTDLLTDLGIWPSLFLRLPNWCG